MAGTSLIATMASKYSMDPGQFAKTVRATVMPSEHTEEQFAAFMLVANTYNLNPITREIYAYPARKGSGIIPVVSLDGWVHLVNDHPACDGFTFSFDRDEKGKLVSCTCAMFRKDRSQPIVVTEFYSECYRNTDPWNGMPARMLRHKALKEAARYAFGFSSLTDEDEARDQDNIPVAVEKIQTPITGGMIEHDLDEFVSAPSTVPKPASEVDAEPTDAASADDAAGASVDEADERAAFPPPSKAEVIDNALKVATFAKRSLDERLEDLDVAQTMLLDDERMKGQDDFIKAVIATAAKVAKGELPKNGARTYLAGL